MSEKKTLILGATGFLGRYFQENSLLNSVCHSSEPDQKTQVVNKKFIYQKFEFEKDIDYLFNLKNVNRLINCVAISDISKCEEQPDLAKWVNSEIPRLLAKKCYSKGIQFVHISTDAVFSGEYSFPTESSIPEPKSIYGISKLAGENYIRESNQTAMICRVNFIGWSNRGQSLFNFIYSNLHAKKSFTGFEDIFFTPLYAADTVKIILELANKKSLGTFHVVGSERISKYQFAKLVAQKFGLDDSYIERGRAEKSSFGLHRNKDLSLSNATLINLGFKIPLLSDGLDRLLVELENTNE